MEIYRAHVLCCGGTGCTSSGSAQIIERFEQQIKEKGLDKEVKVIRTGCFGLCEAGPVVIVYPEGTFYSRVKVEDVDEIVSEHLLKGRPVQHLVYTDHATQEQDANKSLDEISFYKHQHRIALRNCGVINPENIDEYLAFDGYKALEKICSYGVNEIVYVSCNPKTLVNDLVFFEARGYRVMYLKAFDNFPFTSHVEVVSLLQRMSNTRARSITLDVDMEDYHRIVNGIDHKK